MTYDELLLAKENEPLMRKVRAAVVIAANAISGEAGTTPNHVARIAWAKETFADPAAAAARAIWPVLATNVAATFAAVIGANDAAVQTAVNAAVDVLT